MCLVLFSTLWRAWGICSILRYVERCEEICQLFRHLTGFSFVSKDPYKSYILLIVLVIIWLFLMVVPTRMIILVAGLVRAANVGFVGFVPFLTLVVFTGPICNYFLRSLRPFISKREQDDENRNSSSLSVPDIQETQKQKGENSFFLNLRTKAVHFSKKTFVSINLPVIFLFYWNEHILKSLHA